MFCGKLSNIIAQMFGYPQKADTILGGQVSLFVAVFILKKGISCD